MTTKSNYRTKTRKSIFIDALAGGMTVTHAAAAAGAKRTTVYDWRKNDAAFAAQWDVAFASSLDALVAEARRRAVEGVKKYVIYNGRVVLDAAGNPMFNIEYSETLLMFLIKSRDPEHFCDRVRAAKIERKWARRDAKRAATSDDFRPLANIVDLLNEIAHIKAGSGPPKTEH